MTGVRKFYTFDEMRSFAIQNGLDPNTILWSGNKVHAKIKSVYRRGVSSNSANIPGGPQMQLTWDDIDKEQPDNDEFFITPKYYHLSFKSPNGISLYIQPNPGKYKDEELELIEHMPPVDKEGKPPSIKKMKERAKIDFDPYYQRHYYEMPLSGTLPGGLVLIYDSGKDEHTDIGHCTLSVQFPMTVGDFNKLVAEKLVPKFKYIGPATVGKRRQK